MPRAHSPRPFFSVERGERWNGERGNGERGKACHPEERSDEGSLKLHSDLWRNLKQRSDL